ncbi:DoxX family protein [Paraconexibacter sp. AEG42_29]
MGTVGSLHFVVPGLMAETIPSQLPARKALVYVSGVIEVATAVGLRKRAPWAGPVAAATLLAVWPANIQMALDSGTGKNPGPMDNKLLMWGRVPLQLPLIWAALQARPRD